MKRFLLLVLVFLLGNNIWAQSGKLSLSVNFSPIVERVHNERSFIWPDPNGPVTINWALKSRNVAYSFGVSARYAFTPRWSATTGFWFGGYTKQTFLSPNNKNQDPIAVYRFNLRQSRFYQIPVFVNYRASPRKLAPYFSAGALINRYLVSTAFAEFPPGEITSITFRGGKHQVFPTIGAGLSYQANQHLSLLVQPLFTPQFPDRSYSYDRFYSYRIQVLTQLMYTF